MKKYFLTIFTIIFLPFLGSAQDLNEELFQSIIKNDKEQVIQLLKNNADVNYVKSKGPWMTVNMLVLAVNNDNFDIAKILIANKVNVNWKDGFQTSALMYAAAKGNKEMSVLLLDNGADVNANDEKGNTVLSAAKESGNKELINYIHEKQKSIK
jgi:ankyrin repeat protein